MQRKAIAVALPLLMASPAFSEVADKALPLDIAWKIAFLFNVLALFLEFIRPRMGLAVVPFAAFNAWGAVSELTDQYVGPAILQELGQSYASSICASVAVGLLGPVLIVAGWHIARRRRQ